MQRKLLNEQLKQQLLECIKRPVAPPADLRGRVTAFLLAKQGVSAYDRIWPIEWGRAFWWHFYFDERDRLVPPAPPRTPFDAARAKSSITVVISRCGPYVTAESARAAKNDDGNLTYTSEQPVATKADQLAREVGARFGLTYLDAAEMYAWELDRAIVDDAGIDLEASEPSGCILHFYGY